MDFSWIPRGYDPETAFRIYVKIEAYFNKHVDSGKDEKATSLKWIVDSDKFSLCEVLNGLKDEMTWGVSQSPKVWILDKNEGTKEELLSDLQITRMFKMYQTERKIHLLVRVCDLDGTSKCSGTHVEIGNPAEPSPPFVVGSQSIVGSTKGQSEERMQTEPSLDVEERTDVSAEELTKPIEDILPLSCSISNDPDNPRIELHAEFPDANAFRKALRHFAIKGQFEFVTIKSDKKRFIGKCKAEGCPWRIRASLVREDNIFMVTVLPFLHSCTSTKMIEGKNASKSWVSERSGDWLRRNPTAGATSLKKKLEDEFNVKVSYGKAWRGRRAALDLIYGSWEDSFEMLYSFKAEVEMRCPGSVIEVECVREGDKMLFSKVFMALKPCIDGFLHGCRPYLCFDSTHLTGIHTISNLDIILIYSKTDSTN